MPFTDSTAKPRPRWRSSLAELGRCLTARGRENQKLYSFEGPRLLERALAAEVELTEVVVADTVSPSGEHAELFEKLKSRGVPLVTAPLAELLRLGEGRKSASWMALARLPACPDFVDELSSAPKLVGRVYLVAVDIDDPGNVGALTRTALASKVAGFVCVGTTDPFHAKAVRTSMGSIFKVPLLRAEITPELSAALEARCMLPLAAVTRGGTPLPQWRGAPGYTSVALFVGNEARGLPDELLRDMQQVTVPMASELDSFSVNAATAILLYGIRHQTSLSSR